MAGYATDLYPGATEPVWYGDRKVYSVTGFIEGVRSLVADLPSFWVQGEISGFRFQPAQTMVFFNLKDPENGFVLSCTMTRRRYEALGVELSDGDMVHAFGRPEIYQRQGRFQLRVSSVEAAGRGLLMQQLEALKRRLDEEGLFDDERKKPIPFVPRRIGLITGNEAAARDDFTQNIFERFPTAKLVICETFVQGPKAAPLLVAALRRMQQVEDVDVIVLARGGGSFEDLLAFSDERVCRAIAACPTPVVSAIGHERDAPLSDLVADLRASTPTAAARTVVPEYSQLLQRLQRLRTSTAARANERYRRGCDSQRNLRARLSGRAPRALVQARQLHIRQLQLRSRSVLRTRIGQCASQLRLSGSGLDTMRRRVSALRQLQTISRRNLTRAICARVESHEKHHRATFQKMCALSPHSTLARGYSIVRHAGTGTVVSSSQQLQRDAPVTMVFANGQADALVTDVRQGPVHELTRQVNTT